MSAASLASWIVIGSALVFGALGAVVSVYVGWNLDVDSRPWLVVWAKAFLFFSAYDYAKTVVKSAMLLVKEP